MSKPTAQNNKRTIPSLPKKPKSYEEIRVKVVELMNYIDDIYIEADNGIAKIIYDTATLIKYLYENRYTKEVSELMPEISKITSSIGLVLKMGNIMPYYPYTISAVNFFVENMTKYTCSICGVSPKLEPCKPQYIEEMAYIISQSILSPYQPFMFEKTREILTKDLIYLRKALEIRKRIENMMMYVEREANSVMLDYLSYEEAKQAEDILTKLKNFVYLYLSPTYMVYSIALGISRPLVQIGLKLGAKADIIEEIINKI